MNENQSSVESIFLAALEKADPNDRSAYLREACRDEAMRHRVQQLLDAHPKAENFLEPSPSELDATETLDTKERPGTMIGPYKLLQQIGEGGMGAVYMAEQKRPVKRRVALKIIKPGMDSQQVIARFEAERQALAMMDHPNIAKVLDASTTENGQPYFVMELVKGTPIITYCDQHKLTTRERLELLISVCRAVQHAHHKGIIHRDLKPTNVLVAQYDDRPVVKIIDFGVAKALNQDLTERTMFTRFGQVVGTLEYMSPEQATFNQLDVDTRSDIYSLGVVMYELLTGVTPFDKERLHCAALDEVMRIIREEEPPRPSIRLSTSGTLADIAAERGIDAQKLTSIVRGELDWIAMRALEKDRARRYESASAFATDVQRFLDDQPIAARPPSASYRLKKLVQRNRAAVLAGITLLLLLLLGIAGTASGWLSAAKARDDALAARDEASKACDDALVARDEAEQQRKVALDLLEQAHDLVIQRALSQAFGGDVEGVQSTVLQYESVFGGDDEWPQILEATACLHNGDNKRAQLILKPIVDRSPRLIPAVVILSTAHSHLGEWEAGIKLRNRLQGAEPREEFHDLDQLFLGYGLIWLDTERAAELLKDVLDRRPNWLACHAMLANAWTFLAADVDDEALMMLAVRKSTATAEFAQHSQFALSANLHALRTAIEFRQANQKGYDDLLSTARLVAERLRRSPDCIYGQAMCAQYYDVIDDPTADDVWEHVLENGAEMWRWTAVGRLYRDRPADDLLKVLDKYTSTDTFANAAKAYLLTDVPGGRIEAMRIYEQLVEDQPSLVQCYNAVHILLLLGERGKARQAANVWLSERKRHSNKSESTESEVQEAKLLALVASEEPPSQEYSGRCEEVFSHHFHGLIAVANGDRKAAIQHFRKSVEKPHINIDHYWGSAFLQHMQDDDNWPRENPKMTGDHAPPTSPKP